MNRKTPASRRLRPWSIRALMAWVVAIAILCACLRVWPLALVASITAYVVLTVIALLDAAYRLAFGPHPRGFPWPWRIAAAPVRLLDTSTLADEGGTGRAIALAIVTNAALIGGAAAWMFGGANFAEWVTEEGFRFSLAGFFHQWGWLRIVLRGWPNWQSCWGIVLRSTPLWWLLFGALALVLGRRSRDRRPREIARRLLLLSPWLVVIEVEHLWAHWVSFNGSGFGAEPDWGFGPHFSPWVLPHYLIQAPATFSAGVAFFRGVGGWGWWRSVLAAAALVPVVVILSILWFWQDLNPYLWWLRWSRL